jgi:hypothetical protein
VFDTKGSFLFIPLRGHPIWLIIAGAVIRMVGRVPRDPAEA